MVFFGGAPGGKKPSKMIQNNQKNGPKSRSGGGLGSFWAALGPLLGVIWLRAPCEPLPECLLGSSWAVLEASWAPLGRLLGRLGHQVGASWGLLEAFWRPLARFFTLRVLLYLRLSILVDFWIQNA